MRWEEKLYFSAFESECKVSGGNTILLWENEFCWCIAAFIFGQGLLLIIFQYGPWLGLSESKHVFFCFSLTCESIYFGSQPLHHISKPKLTEYLDRQSSLLTFLSEPQPSKSSMLPFLAHSLHRNYMLSNWATSTMRWNLLGLHVIEKYWVF